MGTEAATEATTETATEAATETTTEAAPKPLLTINQPPSWLDELIPFDMGSLSFLFPFTIPIPLPAFLVDLATELLTLLGVDDFLMIEAMGRDLLDSPTSFFSGLAAVLITILLAVFFKGIVTIALPLEVTSAVMAVVLKGLIELFGELMKVLVEDGVGVAAITKS